MESTASTDELDRRGEEKKPTNVQRLEELLLEQREELSEEYLISVVERRTGVCPAVTSAKGGHFDESKG